MSMFVTKRNGLMEEVQFDKITERISKLIRPEETKYINATLVGQKVVAYIHSGISTEELDVVSADRCINLSTTHPLYSNLGGRILVSNLHKNTSTSFLETAKMIQQELDFYDPKFYQFVLEHGEKLDAMIDYDRDYMFDYFGYKTIERSYLIKNPKTKKIFERPQHMYMRLAAYLHMDEFDMIKTTYDTLSQGLYTHASPTLFNCASKRPQLSSCFLLGTDDSIEGITDTWKSVSMISKWGGGIGLHVSNIRAKNSIIRGTQGPSSGIIPMLQVYNNIARYINQCFTGDVKIYTKEGLKPIKNVKPGDQVFTENGRLCEVKKVYQDSYKKEALDMKIMHNFDHSVIVTPEHPFRVIKNQKKMTNDSIFENRLKDNLIEPEWVDAKNVTEDDLIMIPIPTYEKDISEYTSNDCYMYGIMLANGYMCSNKNQIGVKFGHKRDKILKFVKEYLELNLIDYRVTRTHIIDEIIWDISSKFKFTISQLYDDNNIKHFDVNMLNLPLEKAKFIFKGLIDSDGDIDNQLTIKLTSEQVLDSIKYILLRMGILTSGFKIDNITTRIPTWVLKIPKISEVCELFDIGPAKFRKYFRYENMLFTRLESVEKKTIDSIVYDLEIDTNHNYLTEIGLVHNGGKRKGSIAIYLEPHHDDIFEFLELRKNFGDENMRARDLFLSLWISDLFMKQVESDGDWYLMCPDECKGLTDVWGEEYENLYWSYVSKGMYRRKIPARKLMAAIWEAQQETGTPYVSYKDNVNRKSNQKNIGTIKSSNLCNEIVEYSDDKEHAVCNLASIALNKMIVPYNFKNKEFIVYTKPDCNFCKWSKSYLDNSYAKYTEVVFDKESIDSVSGTNTVLNKIYDLVKESNGQLNGKLTFPQIFVKEDDKTTYIGGFNELYSSTVPTYDFSKLHDVAYNACMNLNKIIDLNYYPTPETKRSNMRHRPIGLGIQGLADTLALLRIPFESEKALELNRDIMETIYHASMEASNDKSKSRMKDMIDLKTLFKTNSKALPEYYDKDYSFDNEEIDTLYHKLRVHSFEITRDNQNTLGSYSTFEGSPTSEGIFQFDMWGLDYRKPNTGRYNWLELKDSVKKYGIRNSLLVALMPTASTSQILGNNECFEYFTSNIYTRNTLAGDFPIVNKHLVNDLISIGEWNSELKDFIIAGNGSIQHIKFLPNIILEQYKTQWEIKQIWVLKAAKERGPYVDQTQSMNVFLDEPNDTKLNSCLFWGWKNGLKTGMYYLRSKPAGDAIKFTIDPSIMKKVKAQQKQSNLEECLMCSA